MNRLKLAAAFAAASLFLTPLTSLAAEATATTKPAAVAPDAPETKEHKDARMAWWRAAKFGMFIHWGTYSVPAGTYDGKQIKGIGEWIQHNAKIPVSIYSQYASQMTADKFDADQWMAMAEDAGVKYVVITAKHHEGFAMFHTAVDGYNIFDASPFHRDPLAELAAAAKKHGIKLGFYYSQAQDWHHPGGAAAGGHWDKAAQDGSMDDYIDKVAVPHIKELLTNYGDFPAVLWFDTPQNMNRARADKLYKVVHELRPDIIMNNRLGGGYKGDTETPEQHIPANGYPGRDWESCMTINDTWGYKSYDNNFKSVNTLLFNLVDIVSKGGNYLLNVGPTSEGVIPAPEVERLKAMGAWLKVNGQAIYGCGPSCFGVEYGKQVVAKDGYGHDQKVSGGKDWRCTTSAAPADAGQPSKIFIHLFKWSPGSFELPEVKGKVTKATLLAAPDTALTVSQDGGKTVISGLPDQAPDPICSVLALEVAPQ
jgi:alpha-L-fucosidase